MNELLSRTLLATAVALALSAAFAYQPTVDTMLEVQAAANFTDGVLFECPLDDPDIYIVCVDTSMTPWDAYELSDWADYGLGLWTILESWSRDEDGTLSLTLAHVERGELMLIKVQREFVVYFVAPID